MMFEYPRAPDGLQWNDWMSRQIAPLLDRPIRRELPAKPPRVRPTPLSGFSIRIAQKQTNGRPMLRVFLSSSLDAALGCPPRLLIARERGALLLRPHTAGWSVSRHGGSVVQCNKARALLSGLEGVYRVALDGDVARVCE